MLPILNILRNTSLVRDLDAQTQILSYYSPKSKRFCLGFSLFVMREGFTEARSQREQPIIDADIFNHREHREHGEEE